MAGMATWITRFVIAILALGGWLAYVVFVIAHLSKERGVPVFVVDDEAFSRGLVTTHSLHGVLGAITIAYGLALVPLLLFPFPDQERFEGFRAVAYGWVLCLLGSTAALAFHGWLGMIDTPFPLGSHAVAAILGLAAAAVVALSFVFPLSNTRRWIGAGLLSLGTVALVLTLIRIERAGTAADVPLWLSPHFAGQQRVAILMVALLLLMVVASWVYPRPSARRGEVFGFLLLAWLFFLAAILGHEMSARRIRILDEDLGGRRGWDTFVCVTVSLFLAPVFFWLGIPATRADRLGWFACLTLAAIAVLAAALTLSLPGTSGGMLSHLWQAYDGPRWGAW